MTEQKEQYVIIHADSRNKTSGIVSSYNLALTTPLTRIKSFEIISAEIPFTFNNIWPGNVAVGEFTPSNFTYTFHSRNLLAYRMQFGQDLLKIKSANKSYILNIKIDSIPYLVPINISVAGLSSYMSSYSYDIDNIVYCIKAAAPGGITNVTYTASNYKLTFTITTSIPFTTMELSLESTTVALATFIGLTQSVVVTGSGLTSASFPMPSIFTQYDPYDISYVIPDQNLYSTDYTAAKTSRLRYSVNGSGYVQLDAYDSGTSSYYRGYTFTVDPERHFFGAVAGFNGTYTLGPITATTKPVYPFKYPKHYETLLDLTVTFNDASVAIPKCYIPKGYYTPANLATTLQGLIRTVGTLASSTVTFDANNIITITLVGTKIISSATINVNADAIFGPDATISVRIGLLDPSQTSKTYAGNGTTTLNLVGIKPFQYKPKHLYVGSVALSKLMSNPTVKYVESPLYDSSDIIHKIQVNANSGEMIIDNLFYGKKMLVENLSKTISSIDLTLYDEEMQVVYLNGRHWTISIKITI
jgi:hypothetical protein